MKEKEIRILSSTIENIKQLVDTEEGTKGSFILPFLQCLEYNVFNPLELKAECIADIGAKKGEKVDYVIYNEDEPIIAIECKKWTENLDNHHNQLVRYFHTTKVKIAILTNGIIYKFFSDFNEPNILDSEPFFTFNVCKFTDSDLAFLNNFTKNNFNFNALKTYVDKINYRFKVKNEIINLFTNPDKDLITYLIKKCGYVRVTEKIYNECEPLIKEILEEILIPKSIQVKNETESIKVEKKVKTTEEELEVYELIKNSFPEYNITYKDNLNWFSITLDNTTRKIIAKVKFLKTKNQLIIDKDTFEFKDSLIITPELREAILIKIKSLI